MSKRILVIGAGLGGLAAAIRLARAGHQVEMWERQESPGGKLREHTEAGFRWDTGPSLLTMPHVVDELFADAGAQRGDYLQFHRLASACRYFWRDGTVIDEDEAFWQRKDVARFLRHAKGIYDLSAATYLNHPPAEFWRAVRPSLLPKLRHLPKVMNPGTMAQSIQRWFKDPHLRQLFMRFATYNGSSPYQTPSIFNLIAYVESHFGAWYVEGGMARIPQALVLLARQMGVEIHCNETVTHVEAGQATSESGRGGQFDYIVCNGDSLTARTSYLAAATTKEEREEISRSVLSLSGVVLFLGVQGIDPKLGQHNIFFSQDYAREFKHIFKSKVVPAEPTVYINITSRSEPAHAPEGHENYFVLVNAPPMQADKPLSATRLQSIRNAIISQLEIFGLENLDERIVTESIFTPSQFASRDLAYHGALYGPATHANSQAMFRPPMRSQVDKKVFYVGGTTHPGGGIPLVLMSGKMVADTINREAAKG